MSVFPSADQAPKRTEHVRNAEIGAMRGVLCRD